MEDTVRITLTTLVPKTAAPLVASALRGATTEEMDIELEFERISGAVEPDEWLDGGPEPVFVEGLVSRTQRPVTTETRAEVCYRRTPASKAKNCQRR